MLSNSAVVGFAFLSLFSSSVATCVRTTSTTVATASSSTVVAPSQTACPIVYTANSTTIPVQDLVYGIYAAQVVLSPDERTYYNFSNVRYAAPPVGNLRFKAPQDPVNNRSAGIQDGSYGKICPQAYTPWQNSALVTAPPGQLESEDCLFLDVVVPSDVYAERCHTSRPVFVWLHGGGFQIGSKFGAPASNPLGLLDRSFDYGGDGAIWIGLNYRVSTSTHGITKCSISNLVVAWCLWLAAG